MFASFQTCISKLIDPGVDIKDVGTLGFTNEMKSDEPVSIEYEDEEVQVFERNALTMLDRMDKILITVRGVNEIKEPQKRLEVCLKT